MSTTISLDPAIHNISIYIGADYGAEYRFNAGDALMDLTGYTAYAKVKIGVVETAFTCAINTTTSIVSVIMPRATTAGLVEGSGTWDLFLKNADNKAMPFLKGIVKTYATVTEVA